MYYFAYGSDISKKQMLGRYPDSKPRFNATLPNYKLVFTGWSRQWKGGVASIRPFRGEKVPGAVYDITERDFRKLDADEGYPRNANKLTVTVFNEDGDTVQADTYIRTGRLEETKPSAEYVAIIQQGYRDWGIV